MIRCPSDMKKAYIALKDGVTTLLDCDFISHDEENGLLYVWFNNSLSGVLRMDEVKYAYVTEQRKKEV